MDDNFLKYITLFVDLINLFKLRKDLTTAEKGKLSEALAAARKAAYATEGYYAAQKDGKGINKEKEYQIAELWLICADKVKDYDPDLAERFKVKRNYWVSPEKWTAEQVKAARIGLHDITREAELLLDPAWKKVKAKH